MKIELPLIHNPIVVRIFVFNCQDTMSKAIMLCMVTLIICCATRFVFGKGEVSKQLCDAEKIDTDKAAKVDKILQKECLEKADDMSKFKKGTFCDHNRTDTNIVTKVVECWNSFKNSGTVEMKTLFEKANKAMDKECLAKAGDISGFKKVDLTKANLKQILINFCDENFGKCVDALLKSDKKLQDELTKHEKSTDKKDSDQLEKCYTNAIKK
ncbi:unnamed protein product [Medioppia subpectinata]|uniref:Uncharacterized protein n=1 Tax=Medioppia subpectinata TaxID=1979941 RepID=A0A7R9KJ73_9ACAR|nr:unnamed protein product [Medioppia subpectinata]CAG2103370.1 unnamed protein product [Medioppia subpectinata]